METHHEDFNGDIEILFSFEEKNPKDGNTILEADLVII